MPSDVNYKSKYLELRSKYMNDLDGAFRLGFEAGVQQAKMDQADQQAQQAQEMAQQGQQIGPDGQPQPGQEQQAPGGAPQPGQDPSNPQGSELDHHIAKLEDAIAKSEIADPKELKKALNDMKATRDLHKSEYAIKEISKAMHKPAFKMSRQVSHNISSSAKQAVSLQHKIVSDVMAKMEAEEKRASKDINNILNIEGLIKGE